MNAVELSATVRDLMLAPPAVTSDLPGIGGRLRCVPEDFLVDEVPAYPPDGREGRHLLVRIEKRRIASHDALATLCRHAGVDRREAGVAGRKDFDAVARQWMSVPWSARAALESFDHPDLRILEVHPHGQKLRMGHLRANRFAIVVRELAVAPDVALERVGAKLEALRGAGGLENLYGEQRFGRDGVNLDRGLAAIAGERIDRRREFEASAAQAGLFNLYVWTRRDRARSTTILLGDVVRKTDTGGVFYVDDPQVEQARLDRGEIQITGPIYGAKMRRPPEGTAAFELESEVLVRGGLTDEQLAAHGKRLPGSRRECLLDVDGVRVSAEPASGDLTPGLRLEFEFGAGSYATQLLRELQ